MGHAAGKMKLVALHLFLLIATLTATAGNLKVITSDRSTVVVTLLDRTAKDGTLKQFSGTQDNSLRKQNTARTYRLKDGRILIEFYDRQAVVVASMEDFKKLIEITFVKNRIWNLKKNISYKIELTPENAAKILQHEKVKRLPFDSDLPEAFTIDVYELKTGQVLCIQKSGNNQWQTLYPDLKTLSSDNTSVAEQYYELKEENYEMKRLAMGDPLEDYEPNTHLVYPSYTDAILKSHELTLLKHKVYVSDFHGNLYQSKKGYYVLIDEEHQPNGTGSQMPILTLRIYGSLDELDTQMELYEKQKEQGTQSEHFYQKISDTYGQDFPKHVARLMNELPKLLNFDKDQLLLTPEGMKVVDEAIQWNSADNESFDTWYPAVLAYYGQFHIHPAGSTTQRLAGVR
jgi:hypothetical protein